MSFYPGDILLVVTLIIAGHAYA